MGTFKNYLMLSQRKKGKEGEEFKSKYMLVFYKMDGRHRKGIQIQIYVSVLQNGWVTLGPLSI